jgi:hypothetical protein
MINFLSKINLRPVCIVTDYLFQYNTGIRIINKYVLAEVGYPMDLPYLKYNICDRVPMYVMSKGEGIRRILMPLIYKLTHR